MSASCSILPDSLKSDNSGLLSSRLSTCLDSCDKAKTGILNSFANCFKLLVISDNSLTLLSLFLSGLINCR